MAATAGGIKAGKAFVLIEALDRTKIGLQGVHNSIRQFGSDIASAGQNILMKSIGALIPIGLSEKIYAEFDDSMRKVEARSSGTAAELGALREEAKRLGRETAFTSSQIAELQNKIAQKGFDRSEILSMTESIMLLARAAGEGHDLMLDATTAATLVGGQLRAFKMEAKDTGKLVDLFTTTANKSNYTLEEMGNTLQFVGPEAHAFGMRIEELLALMAGLRDLNIDASIVGTSIRNMFTYMSKASHQEEFNETLQAMTGNTIEFNDAAGNLHSVPDLLLAIHKATEKLGTAERSNLLSEMFGTRVVVSAGALGRNVEQYNKMLYELEARSEGVGRATHDTMEKGIGGVFRELLSSIEAVAISIGEVLSPILAIGATVIDRIAKASSVWILENQKIVLAVIGVVVAVGLFGLFLTALGITISIVGSALSVIITVLTVLTTVLTFVASPLGILILALGACLAVAALLIYEFGDLTAILTGFGKATGVLTPFENIIAGCQESILFLNRLFAAMGKAFAMGDLKLASELAWAEIVVLWQVSTDTLISLWDAVVFFIDAGISSIRDSMLTMIKDVLKRYVDFFNRIRSLLVRAAEYWQAMGQDDDAWAMDETIGDLDRVINYTEELDKNIDDKNFTKGAAEREAIRVAEKMRRQAEIATSKSERDRLLKLAEDLEEKPVEDIDDILRTRREMMDRRADDLIKFGPPGGIVAPKANMGLERGSVEAAKQFQENLYNQTSALGVAKEHLEVDKKALDKLEDMDRKMKEFVFGEVG